MEILHIFCTRTVEKTLGFIIIMSKSYLNFGAILVASVLLIGTAIHIYVLAAIVNGLIGFSALFYKVLKMKNMNIWFMPYVKHVLSKKKTEKTKHIMFCFVDHYEPQWGLTTGIGETRIPITDERTMEQERWRVDQWHTRYPEVAGKHVDADGVHPQHSFFYPEEEYRKEHLDKISDLCARGFGEIEVHLHHDNDTEENLRKTLSGFTELLHKEHGAFTRNQETGLLNYSFIHGNWTLCNCHPEGKYCGVDNELTVLKETGCYADFTYPSAPSNTQTAKINSIYYAGNIEGQSASHAEGINVKVGRKESGDLMIIQGPLALNMKERKKGILPTIENSDVRSAFPPTKNRVDLWVETGVQVEDKDDWIFIKIHTHGTQEADLDCLLGDDFDQMCSYLESKYNDGKNYALHYVSAREMFNIVKAAEAGEEGNPNKYRDYILPRPTHKKM